MDDPLPMLAFCLNRDCLFANLASRIKLINLAASRGLLPLQPKSSPNQRCPNRDFVASALVEVVVSKAV